MKSQNVKRPLSAWWWPDLKNAGRRELKLAVSMTIAHFILLCVNKFENFSNFRNYQSTSAVTEWCFFCLINNLRQSTESSLQGAHKPQMRSCYWSWMFCTLSFANKRGEITDVLATELSELDRHRSLVSALTSLRWTDIGGGVKGRQEAMKAVSEEKKRKLKKVGKKSGMYGSFKV